MAAVITRTEYLSFDAASPYPEIPLNTPAWECQTYAGLYDGPDEVGEDRPIPGSPGRLYVQREDDETVVSLPLVIFGAADYEGEPYDDPREGVRANLSFLRANLLRPRLLRAVTFHRFDGDTETGDVVVSSKMQTAMLGPGNARAVLKLVVTAGTLTLAGS